MENDRIKLYEKIYRESNQDTTKIDKIELLTDYINKLKQIIHQSQFIIENLNKEARNIDK